MIKPSHKDILESVTNDGILRVIEFDSMESFTIVCRYKRQAESKCKVINDKFGQWVYASIHNEWGNPHLSIGYRSNELIKCESCFWLDGNHSQYCKNKKYIINGYTVEFNTLWVKWVVSHDEIGAGLAEFTRIEEAQEYCEKG